jgi:alpha-L-fucosidase 2
MAINPFERAKTHPITLDKPAVNFFEGALLGNGGLGVVVTTCPDGVVLHFGHNSVWDIRVTENHADEIGTFAELFEQVKAISPNLAALEDDPWYKAYLEMTQENYRAPYPRPFPCGSLLLSFDRRRAELLGHRLDISLGLCAVQIKLRDTDTVIELHIFTEMDADRVWLRTVDAEGNPTFAPFERVRLLPDPDTR